MFSSLMDTGNGRRLHQRDSQQNPWQITKAWVKVGEPEDKTEPCLGETKQTLAVNFDCPLNGEAPRRLAGEALLWGVQTGITRGGEELFCTCTHLQVGVREKEGQASHHRNSLPPFLGHSGSGCSDKQVCSAVPSPPSPLCHPSLKALSGQWINEAPNKWNGNKSFLPLGWQICLWVRAF